MKLSQVLLNSALICLIGVSTISAGVKPPKGYVGKLFQNTFALYGTLEGKTKFICTTTPYEKIKGGYLLISAGHCVFNVPPGVVFSVADDINGDITPVTVVKAVYKGEVDIAVFELKTTKVYFMVTFGDEGQARVGDKVIAVNFGRGLGKQVSYGVISSQNLPDSFNCGNCDGEFLVQMFGAGGSSGSVLILLRTHKVIGLVKSQFEANVGMGISKISTFKEFISLPSQTGSTDDEDDEDDN